MPVTFFNATYDPADKKFAVCIEFSHEEEFREFLDSFTPTLTQEVIEI